jgi:hypothetical protein
MPKPQLLRKKKQSQPQASNQIDDDDDDDYDVDIVFGRNLQSRKFGLLVHDIDDEPLSDYVLARLAQARELAMAAYKKAQA